MSALAIKNALTTLEQLNALDLEEHGHERGHGICYEINKPETGVGFYMWKKLVRSLGLYNDWELWSGCYYYPVPGDPELIELPNWVDSSNESEVEAYLNKPIAHQAAMDSYNRTEYMSEFWSKETEYGRARWSLVDHLIKRLTEALAELDTAPKL